MIPDPQSLMWSHYDFASEHVADQVFWRLLNRGRSELEVFLSRTYGLPELAHVRSRLFERFVHHVLPLGGKYELRDLQSGGFVSENLRAHAHGTALIVSWTLMEQKFPVCFRNFCALAHVCGDKCLHVTLRCNGGLPS